DAGTWARSRDPRGSPPEQRAPSAAPACEREHGADAVRCGRTGGARRHPGPRATRSAGWDRARPAAVDRARSKPDLGERPAGLGSCPGACRAGLASCDRAPRARACRARLGSWARARRLRLRPVADQVEQALQFVLAVEVELDLPPLAAGDAHTSARVPA